MNTTKETIIKDLIVNNNFKYAENYLKDKITNDDDYAFYFIKNYGALINPLLYISDNHNYQELFNILVKYPYVFDNLKSNHNNLDDLFYKIDNSIKDFTIDNISLYINNTTHILSNSLIKKIVILLKNKDINPYKKQELISLMIKRVNLKNNPEFLKITNEILAKCSNRDELYNVKPIIDKLDNCYEVIGTSQTNEAIKALQNCFRLSMYNYTGMVITKQLKATEVLDYENTYQVINKRNIDDLNNAVSTLCIARKYVFDINYYFKDLLLSEVNTEQKADLVYYLTNNNIVFYFKNEVKDIISKYGLNNDAILLKTIKDLQLEPKAYYDLVINAKNRNIFNKTGYYYFNFGNRFNDKKTYYSDLIKSYNTGNYNSSFIKAIAYEIDNKNKDVTNIVDTYLKSNFYDSIKYLEHIMFINELTKYLKTPLLKIKYQNKLLDIYTLLLNDNQIYGIDYFESSKFYKALDDVINYKINKVFVTTDMLVHLRKLSLKKRYSSINETIKRLEASENADKVLQIKM